MNQKRLHLSKDGQADMSLSASELSMLGSKIGLKIALESLARKPRLAWALAQSHGQFLDALKERRHPSESYASEGPTLVEAALESGHEALARLSLRAIALHHQKPSFNQPSVGVPAQNVHDRLLRALFKNKELRSKESWMRRVIAALPPSLLGPNASASTRAELAKASAACGHLALARELIAPLPPKPASKEEAEKSRSPWSHGIQGFDRCDGAKESIGRFFPGELAEFSDLMALSVLSTAWLQSGPDRDALVADLLAKGFTPSPAMIADALLGRAGSFEEPLLALHAKGLSDRRASILHRQEQDPVRIALLAALAQDDPAKADALIERSNSLDPSLNLSALGPTPLLGDSTPLMAALAMGATQTAKAWLSSAAPRKKWPTIKAGLDLLSGDPPRINRAPESPWSNPTSFGSDPFFSRLTPKPNARSREEAELRSAQSQNNALPIPPSPPGSPRPVALFHDGDFGMLHLAMLNGDFELASLALSKCKEPEADIEKYASFFPRGDGAMIGFCRSALEAQKIQQSVRKPARSAKAPASEPRGSPQAGKKRPRI